MASPSTFRSASTRGFSLLEVLVVIGLAALLGGLSLFVSMDTYRGTDFRTERDLVVTVLQHARSLAVHNTCLGSCTNGLPHGVRIQADTYTLFQGSYTPGASTNAVYVANQKFTGSVVPTTITFSQLSGTTTCSNCTVTISGEGHTSTITVTQDGQITWTN